MLCVFATALALSPLDLARRAVAAGDEDGDKALNAREFMAQLQESATFRHAVFQALDADADGRLDAEPFEALEKEAKPGRDVFAEADVDESGELSREEAEAYHELRVGQKGVACHSDCDANCSGYCNANNKWICYGTGSWQGHELNTGDNC